MDSLNDSASLRLPRALWILSAVFIVYGTTIPFNVVADRQTVLTHLSRVSLDPFISPDTGGRLSIPDVIGNILLFLPFGAFGMWSKSPKRSTLSRIVLLTLLGASLSLAVETLQLFTLDRTSSLGDIGANTIGSFCGAVGAALFRTSAETLLTAATAAGVTSVPAFYPFLVATIVVCLGAWEPFDVTLDVGSVVPKIRSVIHDPWPGGALTDEALSFVQHFLFAAALTIWLRAIGVRRRAIVGATVGVATAFFLESAQFFIAARMPAIWDASVGAAGALVGVLASEPIRRSGPTAIWCVLLFIATATGAAMQQLSPFAMTADLRPFQWIPFLNYYVLTSSETISHSAELLLAYFPLGFVVALGTRAPRLRLAAALLSTLAIAAPVEYAQRFIGGRYPDITDIAMSVAGGLLGWWAATDGWRRFDRELALISRRA